MDQALTKSKEAIQKGEMSKQKQDLQTEIIKLEKQLTENAYKLDQASTKLDQTLTKSKEAIQKGEMSKQKQDLQTAIIKLEKQLTERK